MAKDRIQLKRTTSKVHKIKFRRSKLINFRFRKTIEFANLKAMIDFYFRKGLFKNRKDYEASTRLGSQLTAESEEGFTYQRLINSH